MRDYCRASLAPQCQPRAQGRRSLYRRPRLPRTATVPDPRLGRPALDAVELERDLTFQAFDDRALGTPVPFASGGEMSQGLRHVIELASTLLELSHVLQGNGLDLSAAAVAVAPQPQEVADLIDRKA